MSASDEIESILRAALEEAMARDAREIMRRRRTAAALTKTVERCHRFTLHGTIPQNFTEDHANYTIKVSPTDTVLG